MSMKARLAVHKFSSCDGCQLAFLNLGEELLTLDGLVDLVHFAEAGLLDSQAKVNIAFVEGSINTRGDIERIRQVRANSDFLVTIGACATAGGLQALRNLTDGSRWLADVYARPEYIDSLDQVRPVRDYVKVDLELWGCPVDRRQVVEAIRALLFGVLPGEERDKVCMECKRRQAVCLLVTRATPCLGPVTRSGCGALCPRFGRDCYGCYGPSEAANTDSLARCFAGLGLLPADVARRFHGINSQIEPFLTGGRQRVAGDD
jgi:coenzyme F420-reducing hydrogenase gamma subunit